jgi:hypothetical protein
MDTVLFTDHDLLVFAVAASAISLVLVLLFSATAEQRVERLESKIRQVLINKRRASDSISNRRMLRQRDDARPAVSIAARTLQVAQRDANGSLRVAGLHTQIQVHHRAATVAGPHQSMMF